MATRRVRVVCVAVAGVATAAVALLSLVPGPVQHRYRPPVATPRTQPMGSGSPTVGSPRPVPSPAGVSVLAFGAKGDGVSDDTAALRRAFASGRSLVFPKGRIFVHRDVLEVRHPGTHLTGGGVLLATNEARSAVWIAADDVLVDGLTFRMATTTRRWDSWEQMKLRLLPYHGITLHNITVDGSAAAGIYIGGTSNYQLSEVIVRNTRADGIHQTGGAHHGRLVHPVVRNAGDDSIAVVSYQSDRSPSHHITIDSPRSYDNRGGRAFSVVGGHDITWTDVHAEGSSCAALYVSSEGAPYFTSSTRRVTVTGGTLLRSNRNSRVDHGAVLLYAGNPGTVVDAVAISDLWIAGTRTTAHANVSIRSNGGSVGTVMMANFTISGGPGDSFADPSGTGGYRLTGWVHNGRRLADRRSPA
jgi:hypothetical protein